MRWDLRTTESGKQIGAYYLFLVGGLRIFWILFQLGAPPNQTMNPPGVAQLERIMYFVEMPGNWLARTLMFFDPELWWLLYPFAILLNYKLVVWFFSWLLEEK